MLKKVEEYALEKFAGDKDLVKEFVDGFVKSAMANSSGPFSGVGASQSPSFMRNVINKAKGPQAKETLGGSMIMGLGKALGEGVGGVLISAGIQGVANLASIVGENNLHTKFLESLANAIQSNRIIKEANKDRVRQYAETIFKFAPNVATDPNLLSSILANAIHGEGIDPMTIKTLTDLESRYKENTTFSPKSYT